MIKCHCCKCGDEQAYEAHKDAWLDGWDFIGRLEYCGKCSVMPLPEKSTNKNETTQNNS
jgi:hypothetical protein